MEDEDGNFPWPWIVGIAAALLSGIAFWFRRRKLPGSGSLDAPKIERPKLPATPAEPNPAAAAQPEPVVEEDTPASAPLGIAIEARQLSISLAAATLSYRITLSNQGDTPITGLAISGDLVSAHASLGRDEQFASAASQLAELHKVGRLKVEGSAQVTGEFRIPLSAIKPIRKDEMVLFVPLVRLRLDGGGGLSSPEFRTLLIGQRPARPGGGLQPFRLDLGPRIYKDVTQRIFS